MNKKILLLACLTILFFISCNNDEPFNQMLDDYYEEGLKFNPMAATVAGDNRYNNYFPNTLSDEYQAELKAYYSNYLEKLNQFKNDGLSENQKMSKAVLKWNCAINLERLTFKEDFFPIDPMWLLFLRLFF